MRLKLPLSGPLLGLLLLAGCGVTQSELTAVSQAAPAQAPPKSAPSKAPNIAAKATPVPKIAPTEQLAPADDATPTNDAAPTTTTEGETAPHELSLLEIFPVQPVTPRDAEGNGKPPTPNANGDVPLSEPPSEALIAEMTAAGEVWVNAGSGAYHKPGTRYYGKTKKGFFLPEAEAKEKGYRGVAGQ